MTITMDYLKTCDLAQLEELYARDVDITIPTSDSYKGVYLKRLSNPGADNIFNHVSQWAAFDAMSFGLNFYTGYGDWFFYHSSVAMGRFTPRIEDSRWRETKTITLNYQVSKLPKPVRNVLYDEIKPLSENIFLGIGGLNRDRDVGDHFFFAIVRK